MLLTALLVGVSSIVYAQRGNGNRQFYGNGPGYFCDNIPNLTADQQTKIDQLRTTHWKAMLNSRNQLAEKSVQLQTLRTADKPDIGAINKVIDQMSAIRTSMQKSREQHFQDVRTLLTDDQRVYFDNAVNRAGNGLGYGRGNGRAGGAGFGGGRCMRSW